MSFEHYWLSGFIICFSLFEGHLPPSTSRSCRRCLRIVKPTELVIRTPSDVFHSECFICRQCGCPLKSGDPYLLLTDGFPICLTDYYQQQKCVKAENEVGLNDGVGKADVKGSDVRSLMYSESSPRSAVHDIHFKLQQRRNRKLRCTIPESFGKHPLNLD